MNNSSWKRFQGYWIVCSCT